MFALSPAWRTVVSVGMALAVVMGVGRFAYTPILPAMQQHAGLSTPAAGALASINFAGYLLGAMAFSVAARWRSRLRLYQISLLLSGITTLTMGLTDNFLIWSVYRFVSGVASAGVLIVSTAITLEALAAQNKNHLLGFIFGGVGAGIALSGIIIAVFGDAVGWRGDWIWLGVLSLVLSIPGWLWLHDDEGPARTTADDHTDRLRPSWPLLLLLASYSLEGLGYIITGTFLVAILKAMPGLGSVGLLAWIVVGLAGVPSTVLWGLLAKRLGLLTALTLANLLQMIGIALPVLSPTPLAALIAAALFGGTFLGIVTLVMGYARIIAPRAAGPLVGLLTIGYGVGQILGPWGAGLLMAHRRSYDLPLLSAAAAVLVAGVLVIVMHFALRRRGPVEA